MKILILITLIISTTAHAMKFKMRAREHYEIHRVKSNSFEGTYKGFSNTVNLWWEKPYDIYYGFSFSPIFSNLTDDNNKPLGKEITFFNVGLELKYFPKVLLDHIYIRPGLGYSLLVPDNEIENLGGYNVYFGLGYEYPFKSFGLALEVAYRFADLEQDVEVQSFTPSIGFHFYKDL